MAIERKVVVDTIEINRNGTTGVRLAVLLVEDGKEIDCKWHRTIIDGVSAADQMAAVNAHLEQMGLPHVHEDEIAVVDAYDQMFSDKKAQTRAARRSELPVEPKVDVKK